MIPDRVGAGPWDWWLIGALAVVLLVLVVVAVATRCPEDGAA